LNYFCVKTSTVAATAAVSTTTATTGTSLV
jgi:hypothetical protein